MVWLGNGIRMKRIALLDIQRRFRRFLGGSIGILNTISVQDDQSGEDTVGHLRPTASSVASPGLSDVIAHKVELGCTVLRGQGSAELDLTTGVGRDTGTSTVGVQHGCSGAIRLLLDEFGSSHARVTMAAKVENGVAVEGSPDFSTLAGPGTSSDFHSDVVLRD